MVSFLLESGGRSGRPGTTGLDGAIDAATVHSNHFAVARVLQAWAAEHGARRKLRGNGRVQMRLQSILKYREKMMSLYPETPSAVATQMIPL